MRWTALALLVVTMVALAGCSASVPVTGDEATEMEPNDDAAAGVAETNTPSGHDARANTPVTAGRSTESTADRESETGAKTSGALELHVDGTPAPGETVTVTAIRNDAPVTGAEVLLDRETVGTTGTDGTLDVRLPADGTTTLRVEHGSASVDARLVFG
ncbi:hypothetical protein [Halomarina oriensis]|uniref:Carboxypeptidase regulatory-like domain-containing protein n=1 Tax=Halomarina oriensis TaxID=671145 RepID=A0A6B0GLD7_9EURY|nr:hypothetical protein [Halomarina oriensis]MWG34701.1 hypothetical protein [Halomarina oriensis]